MDYKNGKIYSIRSYQTDQIYIGSTTQSLSKRFSKHKSDYKKYIKCNNICYISSFKILQFEDAYIELLEECPCENKEQLCKREGELIRIYDCVNKVISGRTRKEYKEQNKDKIKEYYDKNKDTILEKQKILYQENKDKKKEYYNKNKDKIKEYQKIYRAKNKDEK